MVLADAQKVITPKKNIFSPYKKKSVLSIAKLERNKIQDNGKK